MMVAWWLCGSFDLFTNSINNGSMVVRENDVGMGEAREWRKPREEERKNNGGTRDENNISFVNDEIFLHTIYLLCYF